MKISQLFIASAVAILVMNSCENGNPVYPDNAYQTVYFANQYPIRTVELGEDLFVDNSMDNLHQVKILATMGGTQNNTKDRVIGYVVDTTLCNSLYYSTFSPSTTLGTVGSTVRPMPSNYYTLSPSNSITIPAGSVMGGVTVQLTDAFFADPASLTTTYVIPLVMKTSDDSILSGKPVVDSPSIFVASNWSILPKDYVLYAVKYVNPWQANYLRRGIDQITKADGTVSTNTRHKQYVESDDVVKISTGSLNVANLALTIKDSAGKDVAYTVVLTFADDGSCTVGSNSTNFEITGTGKFVSKGEKNSFGGKDRSAIYLDYSVNFKSLSWKYVTKDTLVVRDRGLVAEYYTVIKK
jgi:hypothetical protein